MGHIGKIRGIGDYLNTKTHKWVIKIIHMLKTLLYARNKIYILFTTTPLIINYEDMKHHK